MVERIEDPELRARAQDLALPELHHAAIQGDVELVEALLSNYVTMLAAQGLPLRTTAV